MEEKYLEALKERLGDLTLEESLLRDLYLMELANGDIQGPPVGYSSIDKTWLRNYDKSSISKQAPKMTIYELLYERNKDHLDDIAIEYYGKKISYRELFENIDNTAKSFLDMGVKKGEIVTICSITTPEIIYSFYALNKIGAVINMTNVLSGLDNFKDQINLTKSKLIILHDLFYTENVKNVVHDSNVDNVITCSLLESIPMGLLIKQN